MGLASGNVADAKKKVNKRGKGSVTVSKTTPTAIPAATASTPTATGRWGFTSVPLKVGKKAKGKVVGWNSVSLTTTFTGSAPGALGGVFMKVTAPNGRTAGGDFAFATSSSTLVGGTSALINPVNDGTNTTSGPLTETPDSPFSICRASTGPPPTPPCANPEATVGPPYAGTVGSNGLALFNGVKANGIWTVKLFNFSTTTTATLNSLSIRLTLKKKPPA